MDESTEAALRSALRHALDTAKADGVPDQVRMALLVSELGREMLKAAGDDGLAKLVPCVQAAVDHAARTARSEYDYEEDDAQSLDPRLH